MDYEENKKKGDSTSSKNTTSLTIVKTESSSNVTVEENIIEFAKKSDESLSNTVESRTSKTQKQTFAKMPRKIVARKSLPPSSGNSLLGKDGVHNCFLCNVSGVSNKEGHGLSFKDLPRLKEHYAKCIYNESKYVKFVPPGDQNSDDVGNPIDEFGAAYRCEIKGCWLQKKGGEKGRISYKVLAHHMASQHGVLEKILEADPRPFMQEILKRIKEIEKSRSAIVSCRFKKCSKMQFKADNKLDLKLHYAG